MTEKLTLVEFDALSGVETVRELTPQEVQEREQLAAQAQSAEEALDAKIAARQSALSKLAALGLTEEEIAAL
jgi:DNA-binding NarL/FixJ family response regulator